jgi:hypothetical protein
MTGITFRCKMFHGQNAPRVALAATVLGYIAENILGNKSGETAVRVVLQPFGPFRKVI